MYTSAVLALGLVLASSPVLGYAQQEAAGQAGAGETSLTTPAEQGSEQGSEQDQESGQEAESGTVAEPGSGSEAGQEGTGSGEEGAEAGQEGTDAGGELGSGSEGAEAGEGEEGAESEEALEEDEAARALADAEALAGDVNADGRLSVADLAIAAASLGADEEHADWPALQVADLDGSGSIDRQDLALLAEAILSAEE